MFKTCTSSVYVELLFAFLFGEFKFILASKSIYLSKTPIMKATTTIFLFAMLVGLSSAAYNVSFTRYSDPGCTSAVLTSTYLVSEHCGQEDSTTSNSGVVTIYDSTNDLAGMCV